MRIQNSRKAWREIEIKEQREKRQELRAFANEVANSAVRIHAQVVVDKKKTLLGLRGPKENKIK